MRRAWSIIEATWAETVLRARRLDEVLLHQRVNDEWSFVETLRHLIFAHDRWVRRTILGDTAPFHRLGLPPDNKVGVRPDAAVDVSALGVDVLAEATLDDVLTVREERTREVRTIVSGFVNDDLSRVCAPNPALGGLPPSRQVLVQVALDVLIREEWLHHEFATRDLASLEPAH